MQDTSESGFQLPTLIVVILIALVCMCYLLIFVNPQVALNPFKPPTGVPTSVGRILPPTWTPTATRTPSPTPTSTLTPTPTMTPSPTSPATATRRLPTRTPRPTSPPATAPSPYTYYPVFQSCKHSGSTFIEGTVYRNSAGEPESGVRVALSSGPGPGTAEVFYVTSGTQGKSAGYYVHILNATGPRPGTFYVWVADSNGNALSDPNLGRVTTNAITNPDDPTSCWWAIMDFVHK